MSTAQLPLLNVPQVFQISLGEKDYLLTCKYNDSEEGGWVMDFSDPITNLPIVADIPLVTGVNLLEGLEYLEFGGQLYVFTDGDDLAVPTYLNLGVESNVYFVTDES